MPVTTKAVYQMVNSVLKFHQILYFGEIVTTEMKRQKCQSYENWTFKIGFHYTFGNLS